MPFKINRVYTRGGDKGKTALVDGDRVSKSHSRVDAYGDIDELNAALGLVKAKISPTTAEMESVIECLQQELFDVGAELAGSTIEASAGKWQIQAKDVENLENLCDHFGKDLPELDSFILPGGSELAGSLHLARAIARRAERKIVKLDEKEKNNSEAQALNTELLKYINRLSDLLFVLCRWALSKEGRTAPLWIPANKRR